MNGVLIKRGELGHRDRHTQRKDDVDVTRHREKNATGRSKWHCHKLGISGVTRGWKRQGRTLPYKFQREQSTAHTLISDSWIQSCETLKFCCSKPPSFQTLLVQPQETTAHRDVGFSST